MWPSMTFLYTMKKHENPFRKWNIFDMYKYIKDVLSGEISWWIHRLMENLRDRLYIKLGMQLELLKASHIMDTDT